MAVGAQLLFSSLSLILVCCLIRLSIPLGSKLDINLTFSKLLTSEEKKSGFRYIVRGCVYDSSSIKQQDNLSFVKSYVFVTSSAKQYTYENHDTSSAKLIFPFDLTDYCRFDKKLTVTVNLNKKLVEGKKIALGVYFVKKLDFEKTIEQVHNLEKIRRKKSDITKNQGNLKLESTSFWTVSCR